MAPHQQAWVEAAAHPEDDACVVWPGSLDGSGYGRVAHQGVTTRVTHLVLEASGRPRPGAPANHALHHCPGGDNPACASARHLRWGTHAENMREAVERGGHRTRHGSSSNFARLTGDDVEAIRTRYSTGLVTQSVLAHEFGVQQGTISKVVRRDTWATAAN